MAVSDIGRGQKAGGPKKSVVDRLARPARPSWSRPSPRLDWRRRGRLRLTFEQSTVGKKCRRFALPLLCSSLSSARTSFLAPPPSSLRSSIPSMAMRRRRGGSFGIQPDLSFLPPSFIDVRIRMFDLCVRPVVANFPSHPPGSGLASNPLSTWFEESGACDVTEVGGPASFSSSRQYHQIISCRSSITQASSSPPTACARLYRRLTPLVWGATRPFTRCELKVVFVTACSL